MSETKSVLLKVFRDKIISSDCYFEFHGGCNAIACACKCHELINDAFAKLKNSKVKFQNHRHTLYEPHSRQALEDKILFLQKKIKTLDLEKAEINQEIKRLTGTLLEKKQQIMEQLHPLQSEVYELEMDLNKSENERLHICNSCGHDSHHHLGYSSNRCRLCKGNRNSPCGVWAIEKYETHKRLEKKRIAKIIEDGKTKAKLHPDEASFIEFYTPSIINE